VRRVNVHAATPTGGGSPSASGDLSSSPHSSSSSHLTCVLTCECAFTPSHGRSAVHFLCMISCIEKAYTENRFDMHALPAEHRHGGRQCALAHARSARRRPLCSYDDGMHAVFSLFVMRMRSHSCNVRACIRQRSSITSRRAPRSRASIGSSAYSRACRSRYSSR
jgi:hypothetical protein